MPYLTILKIFVKLYINNEDWLSFQGQSHLSLRTKSRSLILGTLPVQFKQTQSLKKMRNKTKREQSGDQPSFVHEWLQYGYYRK